MSRNGQEIIITNREKPVARIVSLTPKSEIEWPDFYNEAIDLTGSGTLVSLSHCISQIVIVHRPSIRSLAGSLT